MLPKVLLSSQESEDPFLSIDTLQTDSHSSHPTKIGYRLTHFTARRLETPTEQSSFTDKETIYGATAVISAKESCLTAMVRISLG